MSAIEFTWDHVHIRTPDVEAMAKWFADTFGAEILRGPSRTDVRLGGELIFLAEADSSINAAPMIPYQGLEHIGLAVKDIDAVAATLKAKGVEFTKDPFTIRPGTRIAFVRGPLGISVELLERDPKYT